MSAVDEICDAIEKLEGLNGSAIGGPWVLSVCSSCGAGHTEVADEEGMFVADMTDRDVEAELIVTIHRTIDAQLAILQWGLDIYKIPTLQCPSPPATRVLALARAINGGIK